MIGLIKKLVAVIESLIAIVIPLASPTPVPVQDAVLLSPTPESVKTSASATPTPKLVISVTPVPIPSPTPDRILELTKQLVELKEQIKQYTPEPTPSPQIIVIIQTPIPTPTPTLTPVQTSTPTPSFTPTPTPLSPLVPDIDPRLIDLTISKSGFNDPYYPWGSRNVKIGEFVMNSNFEKIEMPVKISFGFSLKHFPYPWERPYEESKRIKLNAGKLVINNQEFSCNGGCLVSNFVLGTFPITVSVYADIATFESINGPNTSPDLTAEHEKIYLVFTGYGIYTTQGSYTWTSNQYNGEPVNLQKINITP